MHVKTLNFYVMFIPELTSAFYTVTLSLFLSLLYVYIRNKKNKEFLDASLFFLSWTILLGGQFHLELRPADHWIIFWGKFQYIGIASLIFTFPYFTSSLIKKPLRKRVEIILAVLSTTAILLIAFTNTIITTQSEIRLFMMQASKGTLFYPFIITLIIIAIYYLTKIIRAAIYQTKSTINYTPVIVGIGLTVLLGIIDITNIYFDRILIPGFYRLSMIGAFIIAVSFAWTFLSQFTWAFHRLTESETEIKKLITKLNKDFLDFIHLIARTIDAKDHYTAGHSIRVMKYAIRIAKTLNLPDDEINLLKQACLLHDIGKIAVPDGILNKKDKLTKKEREYIKRHPGIAKNILCRVTEFKDILDIIQAHHERLDGSGYPDGRFERDIPLLARILAVADSYDAMRSERPYRKAMNKDEAVKELLKCAGRQLDPMIVNAFIHALSGSIES